jgi:hypothetical protein
MRRQVDKDKRSPPHDATTTHYLKVQAVAEALMAAPLIPEGEEDGTLKGKAGDELMTM